MRRLPGIREKKQEILPAGYLFDNRALKRLIAPLIIEQILAVTVGMVDTMMVSSVGEAATSGVSLVDMINTLLIGRHRRSGCGFPVSWAEKQEAGM